MTNATVRIPLIKLWDYLLVPIQGDVTDSQAELLCEDVLERIASGLIGVIIDVSGVWVLDSHLCAVFARLAKSAKLMGAETFLCGLKPEVAMSLQTMGISMEGVTTCLMLEDALASLGIVPHGIADEFPVEGLIAESTDG